jgi:hypothetical protein
MSLFYGLLSLDWIGWALRGYCLLSAVMDDLTDVRTGIRRLTDGDGEGRIIKYGVSINTRGAPEILKCL